MTLVDRGRWRTFTSDGYSWVGISHEGTLVCTQADASYAPYGDILLNSNSRYLSLSSRKGKPILSVAVVPPDGYFSEIWIVTADGLAFRELASPFFYPTPVQAVCTPGYKRDKPCFLTIYGQVHCADIQVPESSSRIVQIVCARSTVCTLSVLGHVTCFGSQAPQPPSDVAVWRTLTSSGVDTLGICGITGTGLLRCWGKPYFEFEFTEDLAANAHWSMVAISYSTVCAI